MSGAGGLSTGNRESPVRAHEHDCIVRPRLSRAIVDRGSQRQRRTAGEESQVSQGGGLGDGRVDGNRGRSRWNEASTRNHETPNRPGGKRRAAPQAIGVARIEDSTGGQRVEVRPLAWRALNLRHEDVIEAVVGQVGSDGHGERGLIGESFSRDVSVARTVHRDAAAKLATAAADVAAVDERGAGGVDLRSGPARRYAELSGDLTIRQALEEFEGNCHFGFRKAKQRAKVFR